MNYSQLHPVLQDAARRPIDEQLNESACLWPAGLETSLDPTFGLILGPERKKAGTKLFNSRPHLPVFIAVIVLDSRRSPHKM